MVAVIFIVGGSLDSDRGGHVFMSDVGMDSGVALASRESEHLAKEGQEGGVSLASMAKGGKSVVRSLLFIFSIIDLVVVAPAADAATFH